MKSTNDKKRILISGSSIAGSSMAYWLDKYGFEVTVVEHAPGLRAGGYGVDLRGAALDVAKRMGVLEQIKAKDTQMVGTYFVDENGAVEGTASEGAMANQHGDIEIMRDDLGTILHNLTKNSVTYIWDDSIADMKQTRNGIDVVFQNSQPQTFDIVIGADGLHSNVRALTFGNEARFMKPLGCYISIFTLDNYLALDHRSFMHTIPGKTVGMYSARNNTEAKGLFVFTSDPLTYDYHNQAQQKQLVANAFGRENGWQTQTLLNKMKKAPDFYFDAICQIHMPTWSKGRVAVVGDAAYGPSPLSGQGSSLALVGAYILAGELYKADDNYAQAFAAYEQKARAFVEGNQKVGMMVADSMIEKSHFKIWLRNTMLRIPGLMSFLFKMITKMIAKAANDITLESY